MKNLIILILATLTIVSCKNNEEPKNEVIQELPKPKPKSESTQKLIT